ncbi:unnamed protein product [marine sediment metagenome]|uniref:Uncharacterized protein n=1 Tax=marine sediment metagenome TaxID=412755 RepID=X1EI36_9ZZZZ
MSKEPKYWLLVSDDLEKKFIRYNKDKKDFKIDIVAETNDRKRLIKTIKGLNKDLLPDLGIREPGSCVAVFIARGKCPVEIKELSGKGKCLLMLMSQSKLAKEIIRKQEERNKTKRG